MPVEMAPPMAFGQLPQIQPPVSENLLQTAHQMQALKMGPLAQEAARLSNEQQQMEIESQKGLMKAYLAAKGDPEKMAEIAPQYGVLPHHMMAVQTNLLNMAKTRAGIAKETLDAEEAKNNILYAAYGPAFDEKDPTKQAAVVSSINQGLLARYPNFRPTDLITYNGADSLAQAQAAYKTHQWIATESEKQRAEAGLLQAQTAAEESKATLPGRRAASRQTARANVAAELGAAPDAATYDQTRDASGMAAQFPPARLVFDADGKWLPGQQSAVQRVGMTAEQRTVADQADARAAKEAKPVPGRDVPLPAAVEEQRVRIAKESRPVTTINTAQPGGIVSPENARLTGEDFLATLPLGTAAQVRAIAEGKVTIPSASTRSQAAIQLRNLAFQYDPGLTEQRAQVRKAFTTGPDGKNIGALNTATVHLEQFGDAAAAMANGSFLVPGNAAYNALRTAFGATAPTNLAQLKAAVAGEMASALKGQATDIEIANLRQNLNAAATPAQFAGAVETNLHILGAKLNTYQQRYQQQIPEDKVWSPVLPAARRVYEKHGFDPTAAPVAGAGFKVGDSVMYQGKAHKITAIDPQTGKLTLEP
jgi:hypothetical protein